MWSTRQLADLAGVTLRTVRWYHEVGLLDEPERAANGYKQYRIAHLVRLLRVRRLADLGLSPARIRELGGSPASPADTLEVLDRELAETIERLQAVRAELALVVHGGAAVDLPPGFTTVRRTLTDGDRSLILLYSRVFDAELMMQLRAALDRERTDAERDFDELPADADQDRRADVAQRYGRHVEGLRAEFPALGDSSRHALPHIDSPRRLLALALAELYNPAQLDVLARVGA
ncbi:MerR family transcriptional regulator [Microbacterium sp. NPDC089695]|uniref:MerR family transcriptional regulator n=1 Tax=Microbacterium sp. NPDC089695 TaxID=3364198 RepID=UPI003819CE67